MHNISRQSLDYIYKKAENIALLEQYVILWSWIIHLDRNEWSRRVIRSLIHSIMVVIQR